MRISASIVAPSLLAVGLLVLVGCQSSGQGSAAENTQVQSMSNSNALSSATISPEMQRFDAGIGDTTAGVGGGGAQH